MDGKKKPFPLCLQTAGLSNPASIDTYLSIGGYSAIKKILKEKISPETLINEIKISQQFFNF